MLGRGTRKGEKFPDKSHFTVFDCFDGTLLEYFRQATGDHGRAAREADADDRRDHRGHLGEPGPRLQRPLPRQAPPADRQGDGAARPATSSPAFGIPTATSAGSPRSLPTAPEAGLHGDDEAPPRPEVPGAARRTTRAAQRTFVMALDDYEDTVIVRSGLLARGTVKPEDYLQAFARFVRENAIEGRRPSRILLDRPQGLEHRGPLPSCGEAARRPPASASPWSASSRPTSALRQGPRRHHLDGEARGPRGGAAPDRRGAGRPRPSRGLTAGRTVHAGPAALARPHPRPPRREPVDRPGRLRGRAGPRERAGGWGAANRAFDGKLPDLLHALNEAIAA